MHLPPVKDESLAAPKMASEVDPAYFLPKLEPNHLMAVILRRGWIVVLLSLLGAWALFAYSKKQPEIFRAYGSVYVGSEAPVVLDVKAVAAEEAKDLEQMRSVEQGLMATTVLMKVIERHQLDKDPLIAGAKASPQAVLAEFSKRVSVSLRRGTRLIDIRVEDTDPQRAKELVESLVSEYERWTNQRQQDITNQASAGLAKEEQRLRARVDEAARKLQQFREEHQVPGLEASDASSPKRDALATLTAELTQAQAIRLKLEAEFEAFSKFDVSRPEAIGGLETSEHGAAVMVQIRELQAKQADFERIKERYLFRHPVYQEYESEIAMLKSNLAESVRSAGQALEQRYQVAQGNELKLAAEVEEARKRTVEAEGLREQFRAMAREEEAQRALHQAVASRLRETNLAATVPASVLRWEDLPMLPEKAIGPRKAYFAAGGGILGGLLGLMLLLGLEFADRKVRNTASAARAIGAPLLATLPASRETADAMVVVSAPQSASAEAFRRLRAVLSPPTDSVAMKTVLFTSAKHGEGKSHCALNYAASLAMQGYRTLLLDADMRSAGLSSMHIAGEESGLAAYLSEQGTAADACFPTALPNLYLLASGPLQIDSAEKLGGTRFATLLDDAYRWFDRVVIDTPPVLAVSDMLAIARYAGRTCLVVGAHTSDIRSLKKTSELIRSSGGNVTGFVWNEGLLSSSSHSQPPSPALTPLSSAPKENLSSSSQNLHETCNILLKT